MNESFVTGLADQFGVPETSVQVLNTLVDGNDFYNALRLRSEGISLDRVVGLFALPIPFKELKADLEVMRRVLQTTNPNIITEFYSGLYGKELYVQELFDAIVGLPPAELTNEKMVLLNELDHNKRRIILNLLEGHYRDSPEEAEHFYEHLDSQV